MSQGQFLSNCAADTLSNAAESLKSGAVVAFPTETVYGLGADASNEKAVARIYEVKGRPQDHPLILRSQKHQTDLMMQCRLPYSIYNPSASW